MRGYNDFLRINEERSKNDPIPEISQYRNKLGIILLGTPAVGKSTFVSGFILPKNQIKVFSTDDVSLTLTGDPNVYRPGASELNVSRLKSFISGGSSFIYDTTGTQEKNINNIISLAKGNGYKIIFIHLIGDLDMSLRQNKQRDRQVDVDYIKFAYENQFSSMKMYSNKSDGYYIVYNLDGKYKFFKYKDGKMMRRKVDKYVPMNESKLKAHSDSSLITLTEIVDVLQELIDEYDIIIYPHDKAFPFNPKKDTISDDKFIISKRAYNYRSFGFGFEIKLSNIDYYRLISVMNDVKDVISNFKSRGWSLSDFDIDNSTENVDGDYQTVFRSIVYRFQMPALYFQEAEILDENDIIGAFHNRGLTCTQGDISWFTGLSNTVSWVQVYFTSDSFDGEEGSGISKKLSDISGAIGASEYNQISRGQVIFYFDDTPPEPRD